LSLSPFDPPLVFPLNLSRSLAHFISPLPCLPFYLLCSHTFPLDMSLTLYMIILPVCFFLPLYIFLTLPISFSSCLSRCFSHPLTLCMFLYLSLDLSVFLSFSACFSLYFSQSLNSFCSCFFFSTCLSSFIYTCLSSSAIPVFLHLSTCSCLTPSPSASLPVSLYLCLFLHMWFSLPVSHPPTVPSLSILLPVSLSF